MRHEFVRCLPNQGLPAFPTSFRCASYQPTKIPFPKNTNIRRFFPIIGGQAKPLIENGGNSRRVTISTRSSLQTKGLRSSDHYTCYHNIPTMPSFVSSHSMRFTMNFIFNFLMSVLWTSPAESQMHLLPTPMPTPSQTGSVGATVFVASPIPPTPTISPEPTVSPQPTGEPTTTWAPSATFAPTDTWQPSSTFAPTDTFSPTDTFGPTDTFQPTTTFGPTTTPWPTNSEGGWGPIRNTRGASLRAFLDETP